MKTIAKNELFDHLNEFLKTRGIELRDGTYASRIRQGCNLLADAINATQKTLEKARTEVDEKLRNLRKSLHKATAPKPPVAPTETGPSAKPGASAPATAAEAPRPAKKTARPGPAKKRKAAAPKKPKRTAPASRRGKAG